MHGTHVGSPNVGTPFGCRDAKGEHHQQRDEPGSQAPAQPHIAVDIVETDPDGSARHRGSGCRRR